MSPEWERSIELQIQIMGLWWRLPIGQTQYRSALYSMLLGRCPPDPLLGGTPV